MKIHFIIFSIGVFLFACHSNSSTQPDTNTVEQYAYITGIIDTADNTFIKADYVQFLTGNAAIEAAKKKHMADTFVINGKTHIDVPNDYFILNESKKIRELKLAKGIVFELLLEMDRVDPPEKIKNNSLTSFRKIYKDNLFILSIANEEVVKIKEVFLP